MLLTKLSLAGKIKLFAAKESLVSDTWLVAGEEKIGNLFYSVWTNLTDQFLHLTASSLYFPLISSKVMNKHIFLEAWAVIYMSNNRRILK